MEGLPPEIISGQIYSGPGVTPLIEAAQAWVGIADQYETAVLEIRGLTAALGAVYQGESAQTMAAAMARYVTWVESTESAARQTAAAAMGAALAYEQALASVVPPPVIASNRAQLLLQIATNLLGQNSAAIAALEAQYEGFWAADVAAMTQYRSASLSSTAQLPTFEPAAQVSNLRANPQTFTAALEQPAASGGLVGLINDLLSAIGLDGSSPISELIYALLSAGFPVDIVALFTSFFGPFLGSSVIAGNIAAQNAIIASKPTVPSVVYPPVSSAAAGAPVTASAGNANRLGRVSVPHSWALPPQRPAATPLAPAEQRKDQVPIGVPVIPAVPVTGGRAKKRPGYSHPDDMHYGAPSPNVLPRNPSGG